MSLVRNPQESGRKCCTCGGDRFRLLHEWETDHPRNSANIPLSVWQCQCGLAMLHPIPTAEQLPASGDWWTEERQFLKRRAWIKTIRKPLQNLIFGEQKMRFVRQTRRAIAAGKLLDIGCGSGSLLRHAKRWFKCEGVEPSAGAATECRKQGLEVTNGFFEDVDLPAESYDVVTMYAVLEHVYDPVKVLSKANHILKPNGIVAIKVPKLYGPAHRIHGREWNGFRIGYHTYLFTGAALAAALNAAGFEVLTTPKRDRALDDILILWGTKKSLPQSSRSDKAA